jgi:hypothetical protein
VSVAFTYSSSVSNHSDSDVLTQSNGHSGQTESGASTSVILHYSKKIHPQKELQSIISQLEEENRCNELINEQIHLYTSLIQKISTIFIDHMPT